MKISNIQKTLFVSSSLTLAVILLVAWLVFKVWFPYPFNEILNIKKLYFIFFAAALSGPLFLLIILKKNKSRRELILDSVIVIALQIFISCYALYAIVQTRPIFIVATDRLDIVRSSEITDAELAKAPKQAWRHRFKGGPKFVSVNIPSDMDAQQELLMHALSGKDAHLFPELYTEMNIKKNERDIKTLMSMSDLHFNFYDNLVKKYNTDLTWMPIYNGRDFGIVVFDKNKTIVAWSELDPYLSKK